MRLTSQDVSAFARWSGDRNPLHVDSEFARRTHFGENVAHGVLALLRALADARLDASPVRGLEVEFRHAIVPGREYDVAGDGTTVEVSAEGETALVARTLAGEPKPATDARISPCRAEQWRSVPADRDAAELMRDVSVTGRCAVDEPSPKYAESGLTPLQIRVLGLCSYAVGMELPGRRSLFTRLRVEFHAAPEDVDALDFRLETVRYSSQLRILDTALVVAAPGGEAIAAAELRSYVPFSPVEIDVDALAGHFGRRRDALSGKVALVCGGSRGLGAEIVAALALCGCRVYASGRAETDEVRDLAARLGRHGAGFEFVAGDAGDAGWCETVRARILDEHGRLDYLMLNACAPPSAAGLTSGAGAWTRYVADNLPLVQTPLATFIESLAAAGGTLVATSSSTVASPLPQLAHYTALKHAVEGLVRSAADEFPGAAYLLPRPPRLRTSWNDTPAAAPAAIPSERVAVAVVERLSDPVPRGEVRVLDEFPEAGADDASPAPVPDAPAFNLAICATFTAEPLRPALEFWFDEIGVPLAIEQAGYGQVMQELLNPTSLLSGNRNGANLVAVRVRDWLRELPDATDAAATCEHLERTADELVRAVRAHRGHASEETVLLVCPSDLEIPDALDGPIADIESRIVEALDDVAGLTVVRACDFHRVYAVEDGAVHDPLRDEIAHIPYREAYLHTLGTIVARCVYRRLLPLRKVLVVDCDNTLWQGVVGEDGPEGVSFGPHHRALHAFLTRLSGAGTLICLCSKNEEADVWQVFDRRSELALDRDHIVAATINWQPKSENLATLASRLNVGLDSFVFLDDNPVECAEVRAACPEVLTLEWPREPERAQALLDHLWDLDVGKGTTEDSRRTQLYRDEYGRKALMDETPTFQEFLDSLELEIGIESITDETLARASQMTMRTNQFNFTTRRRDEGEIAALLGSDAHECRIVRVRDRFGDYGIVGLLVATPAQGALEVDTFLLSCRVLGRGVEHRMAAELGRIAAERGSDEVVMRVETTRKNRPARKFLQSIALESHVEESSESALACRFPAAWLIDLRYDPSAERLAESADSEDAGASAPDAPGSELTRRRERQIARTAFELATAEDLARAIGAVGTGAGPAKEAPDREDVTRAVHSAFAATLRIPEDEVAAIDDLEALGCDSMKIVDITVQLVDEFPWLPSTLLFEHRTVSGIVAEIAALSLPADRADAKAVGAPVDSGSARDRASGDVAVVGMALRCGGARSPDELWRLLAAGATAVRPVPEDRPYFLGRLRDVRPHWAALLEDVDGFDAEFFGVSPREAQSMDPQLRILMEVAWEALEDAGLTGARHSPETGVWVGVMYGDYVSVANHIAAGTDSPYRSWEGFSLANRLSQFMAYSGPSVAIDTACSSSATALHHACQALAAGDCRVAVVAGLNLVLDPNRFVQLGRLGILSPTGECHPFGAGADGTNLGEGVGAVVLEPLEQARRDGDRVYGVIKGSGLSTGAGTVGFTAPNPNAQAEAIRRAITTSGVDPRTVSYVETHGTGTELGDPIEVRGLSLTYEDPGCWHASHEIAPRIRLGSIKPNVGHLEAGAAVLGLIKVLLQLDRGHLVPSLTSDEPNPQIPFGAGIFSVQRALEPWERPRGRVAGRVETLPRRAGLSSFGVGGANAHFVIEEAPETPDRAEPTCERSDHVLLLSARTERALRHQAAAMRDHLAAHTEAPIADVCYALATRRRHLDRRLAAVASERGDLADQLEAVAGERPGRALLGIADAARRGGPRVAFLFTGQGSQHAGMGRELHATQPVFRDAFERCCELFDPLLGRSLREIVFGEVAESEAGLLDRTRFTQPALFALQYALATLWRSWGVEPAAVVGHSIGEFAAACVAGGLALEDAARLVEARGRLMQELPAGGAMVSVRADEATARDAIEAWSEEVAVAAVNAPEQVVISGEADAVAAIARTLEDREHTCTPLTVSHAFHSPLMDPMLDAFGAVAEEVEPRAMRVPFLSSVDAQEKDVLDAAYWSRQVRSPVRFADAFEALRARELDGYVEIGPHPVLLGMARACAPGEDALWLPSQRRGAPAWPTLLESVARLHVRGASIDWESFDAPYSRRAPSLPPYAFEHRSFWIEGGGVTVDLGAVHAPEREAARLRYRLAWRPVSLPTDVPAPEASAGRWVVFSDAALGGSLAPVLGDAVVDVGGASPGTSTVDLSAVDPGAPVDLARAWDELARDPTPIRGVVVAWGLEARASDPEASAGGTERLDAVVRALGPALGLEPAPRIWLVTRGAVDPGERDAELDLDGTSVWGLGRVLALEHPDRWGGLVDLDRTVPTSEQGDALARAILAGDEDQVALRHDTRYAPRLVTVEDRGESSSPLVRSNATYLVTGGTGAIGRACTRWLADNGARRLVLASRRGARASEASALAEELRGRAVQVELVAADTSLPEDVERMLVAANPAGHPLRGVFHVAGADERVALRKLDTETIARVFLAKARGGWLLHRGCEHLELDHFVCFSSMAAWIGSPERGHYAAANAFLDGLAALRRARGLPALSVAWGPWSGGGVASVEDLAELERIGNRGLDPGRALAELGRAMNGDTENVAVMDIDWPRFRAVLEARRPMPLLAEVGHPEPATGEPAAAPEIEAGELRSLPAGAREQRLVGIVRGEVARTLGFDAPEQVDVDGNYFDMGLDSLMAVELATRLETHLGAEGASALYEHPTVRDLVSHLLSLAPDEPAGDGTTERQPEPEEPEPAPTNGIIGYSPELEPEIAEFQHVAWPERPRENETWRWMCLDSAERLHRRPEMWFYRDDERIVGETAAIPVRLKVGAEERDAAWLVDSMVLEEHRERAIGTRILIRAMKDRPLALSLGQEPYMREILLKTGWQTIGALGHFVYPLRSRRILEDKLPAGPIAWTVAGVLDAATRLRRMTGAQRLDWQPEVSTVDRFGEEHDALWTRVREEIGCGVVRDASFLNWKYVDRPDAKFECLEVRRDGTVVAVAVIAVNEPDDVYGYRRAFLVDLVLAPTDRAVVWATLEAVRDHCHALGADAIHAFLACPPLERSLKRFGYIEREATRYLLATVNGLDESAASTLTNAENWLCTLGDSDLDRVAA